MPDTRLLADQVWALLQALDDPDPQAGVNVFRGGLYDENRQEVDPPVDDDGLVHPYAVFYPAPGRRFTTRLCATPNSLDWTFQVTCAGGDDTRVLWCLEEVRGGLLAARLDSGGGKTGQIRELGDPGPLRVDRAVTPHRPYFPLLFGVFATS